MNDKPMFYGMNREFSDYVTAADEKFAVQLAFDLGHLVDLGAESNEVLSALAHWTSLFAAAGTVLIEARAAERGFPTAPPDVALNIFLQDVIRRIEGRRPQNAH